MQIPGHIDPVPVDRPASVPAYGRIDLIGLGKSALRETIDAAALGCARR